MKVLIVEDEFSSRVLLQRALSEKGECHIAVDGTEAISAFSQGLDSKEPYDLICLDILMPRIDGIEVLRQIREIEASKGIGGHDGVKVVMTTGLNTKDAVLGSFRTGCEAYLKKPISRENLLKNLKDLGLLTKS